MRTRIDRPGVWAVVLGALALALAGCDTVKDVRSEPSTALPTDKQVLKGVINGLGGGRAITLTYNGSNNISLVGADPSIPTDEPEPILFTFGSLEVGTEYNVIVAGGGQPFGKHCEPVSGNTGTLTKGQETNVVIECTPDIPRFDLTVTLPSVPADFTARDNARIILYTGEQMHQRAVTPGQPSVTFEDALFTATITIPNPNPTPGGPATVVVAAGAPLNYYVAATFDDDDGNESRCAVNNYQGSNPPGNVTNVSVGACEFTMSGSVAYSTPQGGVADTGAIPGGLELQVRDLRAEEVVTYEVSEYGAFTIGGSDPVKFLSNAKSTYDIVVTRQPAGRTCVVGDGGGVSLYRTGSTTPANITATASGGGTAGTRAWGSRLNVFCRVLPEPGRALTGTYRLTSSTWKPAVSSTNPNPTAVTATYDNYDWTVQNKGSSNMLTFFADGTFLYGTHAYIAGNTPDFPALPASMYSTQVEHGFYTYDPAGTLRFTLITDTNPIAAFPGTYAALDNVVWNAARTGTHGLSASPAPDVIGSPSVGGGIGIWNAVMNNVQKTSITFNHGRNPSQTLSRITGTFGGATSAAARLDWELTEPQSLDGEMTGSWVSSDNRRFWVWDYLTYYGTHVGVVGGAPSMNDACFTVSRVDAPHGTYMRRGPSTGCYAYNRPPRDTAYLFSVAEAADFHLTDTTLASNTFVGIASLATAGGLSVGGSRLVPQFGTAALAVLPGFVGRMPGGQSAADGRSPSPVVYMIAPATTFASQVASTFYDDIGQPASRYFDNLGAVGAFTEWCQTEVLGVRASLNGVPLDYPVYFCRTRAGN